MTVENLVDEVLQSPKYRTICPAFVRRVVEQEFPRHPNPKATVKAVKNKLHQVGGAYLGGSMPYPKWLKALIEAENDDGRRHICQKIMQNHASTKERLPILETFYQGVLADIAPITSMIDIACGLNPLAIPWMPLTPDAEYYAYDIYRDMADFLHACLPVFGMQGHVQAQDIGQFSPPEKVQLALVLKTLPCLEQVDKTVSFNLLNALQANYLLVSFPVRSLGGKNKGMVANYESRFMELISETDWQVQRFEFATELVFRVKKC